jgi:hypothetical protein
MYVYAAFKKILAALAFFHRIQGCRMVYFLTKNTSLGKILEGLGIQTVGIFYGTLVYFTAIWYIFFPLYGILCREKSGNHYRMIGGLSAGADVRQPLQASERVRQSVRHEGRSRVLQERPDRHAALPGGDPDQGRPSESSNSVARSGEILPLGKTMSQNVPKVLINLKHFFWQK